MEQLSKRLLIEEYVISARLERGIQNVDCTAKRELSGIMHGYDGEIESLIDRGLLTTEIGAGAWVELQDQAILDAVFRVVAARAGRQEGLP